MKVGEKIRQLRQKNNMSQRELAKKVSLPNSTLSMIERDVVSPSISNLHKILNGLDMPLSQFFAHEPQEQRKVIYKAQDLTDIGTDGLSYLLVGADKPQRQLTFLLETCPPGKDTGKEWISHKGNEIGTVLSGELTIKQNNKEYVVNAGDCYFLDTELPHQFSNNSDIECKLVSAMAPVSF